MRARPKAVVDEAEVAMRALRFLSDANRLRLLTCLAHQEACGSDLTSHLGLPQPLVSYHLRRLSEAGLVRSQRRVHRIYYAIDRAGWETFTRPIRGVCALVEGVSDEASSTTAGESGRLR